MFEHEKILELKRKFNKRKFKLRFRKTSHWVDWGTISEVTDSYLTHVLLELQKKYDFEVLFTDFKGYGYNHITIKCDKEDKYKIFSEYCLKLSNHIENVSF